MKKEPKTKDPITIEDPVQSYIVHGGGPEGSEDSMVERIYETGDKIPQLSIKYNRRTDTPQIRLLLITMRLYKLHLLTYVSVIKV